MQEILLELLQIVGKYLQPMSEIKRLQDMVSEFCKERDWDQFHDAKELAIGMITECSELLEVFRFHTKEESEALLLDPAKRIAIEDELADVLFFLLRFSGRYAVDLPKALENKMAKNRAKYPVEKARGSKRKYDEL